MKDITYQRKLQAALQQSEEQFKEAFLHSAAGMAIVNNEGYHIEVNANKNPWVYKLRNEISKTRRSHP
jgi:PAS domain-containing protein